jgi:primosomal replication protein N''
LAQDGGVTTFNASVATNVVTWPRGEILEAVAERIEGFARCSYAPVNDWADRFRLERRMPLDQALVLLSVPQEHWQEPHKQQYVSHLLSFFEKKVVNTVMRGPLVRMTIGKSTPRVVPSSEIPGIHGPCSPGFLISTRVTAPRGTWDPAGKV